MHRHSIDPVAATLGVLAIGLGTAVATGRADSIVDNGVWWGALVAIPLGVALVPWGRLTRSRRPGPPALDASDDVVLTDSDVHGTISGTRWPDPR